MIHLYNMVVSWGYHGVPVMCPQWPQQLDVPNHLQTQSGQRIDLDFLNAKTHNICIYIYILFIHFDVYIYTHIYIYTFIYIYK